MVNWLAVFTLATAGMGVWEVITGRPLFGAARWPLNHRATRWGGVYTFTGSLVVVALLLTYPSGVAFMTYAVLSIAFGVTIQAIRMRRTSA